MPKIRYAFAIHTLMPPLLPLAMMLLMIAYEQSATAIWRRRADAGDYVMPWRAARQWRQRHARRGAMRALRTVPFMRLRRYVALLLWILTVAACRRAPTLPRRRALRD